MPVEVTYICLISHPWLAAISAAYRPHHWPMIQPTHRLRTAQSLAIACYRLIDIAAICSAFALVGRFSSYSAENVPDWLPAAVAVIGFGIFSEFAGLYRDWRASSLRSELVCVLTTWALTIPWFLFVPSLLTGTTVLALPIANACSITAAVILLLTRYVTRLVQRSLCARGINRRGCALVGVTDVGLQLAQSIQQSPELGMELIGFYDDRPQARTAKLPTELGARLGNIDELVAKTRSGKIQTVYITLPMRAEKRIRDVLDRLSDSTATVYFVPDFFVFQLLHARWSNIQGLPVVSIFENPFYGVDGIVKHALDFILATCLILVFSPLLLAIAIAVKLTSSGPVFFRQRRYGIDGREILVWKFRSMRVCEDGDRVVQAKQGDARFTPIGGFLRKTSLDELPQLFNVVAGQMSLVGPRPHANAHNELYRKQIQGYMLRHKVRPGITGLAQVNGWRGETDTLEKMEKRIECDHQYIREWTLWLDMKILLRTISVVFSRNNAY